MHKLYPRGVIRIARYALIAALLVTNVVFLYRIYQFGIVNYPLIAA